MIARRVRQRGVDARPHRFRHHFSYTWPDRGGAERDLVELSGHLPQPVAERQLASRAANLTGERVRNTSCRCRPAMSGRVPGRRGE
jgi:hypothetical protein